MLHYLVNYYTLIDGVLVLILHCTKQRISVKGINLREIIFGGAGHFQTIIKNALIYLTPKWLTGNAISVRFPLSFLFSTIPSYTHCRHFFF